MPTLDHPTRRDWHLCLQAATHGFEEWRDEAIEAFLKRELLEEIAHEQGLKRKESRKSAPSLGVLFGCTVTFLALVGMLLHGLRVL